VEIYIVEILLLGSFSLLRIDYYFWDRYKIFFKIISLTTLIALIGLRWETGTDWNPYFDHFISIDSWDSTSPLYNGFEFGYNLYVYLFKLVSSDYSFFLLFHAVTFYIILYKGLINYTVNPAMSLLLFYSLFIGITGANRQLLALALCVYSVKYIFNRDVFKFLLMISLATLLHTSSLLFLIMYLLNRDIRINVILTFFILIFLFRIYDIPNNFFSFLGDAFGLGPKADFYLAMQKEAGDTVSVIGIFKRMIVFFTFLVLRKRIVEKFKEFNLFFNGYFVGVLIYVAFAGTSGVMISRGSVYFNFMEVLLWPSLFFILKPNVKFILGLFLIVLSVVYFFQSISPYSDLFLPYKGVFYNVDLNRNMH
jgi:hypothetical protein